MAEVIGYTEWQLQDWLTVRWARDGIEVAGEHLSLVAWEVMLPSWRVNDAFRHWNEPSIDFLAADSRGGLVAIEVKRRIHGEKEALRAACQVTDRAARIDASKTADLLEAVHHACISGQHGRPAPAWTPMPIVDLSLPTGAVLAAPSWTPTAIEHIRAFGERSLNGNVEYLSGLGLLTKSPANRECRRYLALSASSGRRIQPHLCPGDQPITPDRSDVASDHYKPS